MNNELLIKYIKGDVSDNEIKQVVEWLNDAPENEKEYKTLMKLHTALLFNPRASTTKRSSKLKDIKPRIISILRYAAVVLMILGLQKGFKYLSSEPQPETIYSKIVIPTGQRAELYLPDSTKVWLNSQAELSYPTNFGANSKREVLLKGEAYFDVQRNENAPFIVSFNKTKVEVLGTEFNINTQTKNNDAEINLVTGSIKLFMEHSTEGVIMKPEQTAKIKDLKLALTKTEESKNFMWREGIISFEKESLRDIFNRLEEVYRMDITVSKEDILNRHYSGKFSIDDGIDNILQLLQFELEFTYTKDSLKRTVNIN